MKPEQVFPKHVKANQGFKRMSDLIDKIQPEWHNILVEVIPLTKVPPSKLIIPDNAQEDAGKIFSFNYIRAVLIAKGPDCKSKFEVGDEVYYPENLAVTINYPNPDHKDKHYQILSEMNVAYSIKK